MADDIRVKFTADGSSYNKQLKDLVQQNKTLKSETDKVKSSIDKNTTAEEKAAKVAKALQDQIKGEQEYLKALESQYKKVTAEQGENSAAAMKQEAAINKAKTTINKLNAELEEAEKAADGYGDEIEDAAESTDEMSTAAKMLASQKLADIFNKIGDGVAKMGKATYNAAKELDTGYDTIIKKTGATGKQLDTLKKSADNVFGSLPVDMAEVGTAIGEINTRFGLTGDALEKTSQTFLKFANITETDVNTAIGTTSRLLKTYGGDVEDVDNVLGYLADQSQKTGISTDKLMSALDQGGSTLRSMGLNLQQSTRLLAIFEQNGVESTAAMTGLRKAVVNGAKAGKSFDDVMKDAVKDIKGAKTQTEAMSKASELFGTKAAVVMADGIRSGRISLEDLSESIEDYSDVVGTTFEATLDPWDRAKTAMNNLKTAGADLANNALAALAPILERVTKGVQDFSRWFQQLPSGVKVAVAALGGLLAITPKLLAFFQTIKTFSAAKAITEMGKLGGAASGAASNVGSLSSKLGDIAKTGGLVTGIVAGIGALNSTLKDSALKSNELYQSSRQNVEIFRQMAATGEQLMTVAEAEKRLAEYSGAIGKDIGSVRELVGEIKVMSPEVEKFYKAFNMFDTGNLGLISNTVIEELKGLFDVVENGTDTTDEYSDALDTATDATGDLGDASGDMAGDVEDAADVVADSFYDIYKSAKTDLQKTISIMDEWADEGGKSMDEFAAIMAKNAQAWSNWDKNVKTLTGDARYQTDTNFRAMVDSLISMEGKGAVAMQQFADAVRTGNNDAVAAWTTGAAQAKVQQTKVVNDLAATKAGTQTNINQMVDTIKNGGTRMVSGFSPYVTTVSEKRVAFMRQLTGMVTDTKTATGNLVTAAKTGADNLTKGLTSKQAATAAAWRGIVDKIVKVQPDPNVSYNSGATYAQKLAAGIQAGNPKVLAAAGSVRNAAEGAKPSSAGAYDAGAQIPKQVGAGMDGNTWAVSGAAGRVASAATSGLSSASNSAYNWGAELGAQYARGMESKSNAIRIMSIKLANAASSSIHFSLPDEGPLRNIGKWGPEMAELYAKGMTSPRSMAVLERASLAMAEAVSPTLTFGEDGINGKAVSNSYTRGDTTVNVYAKDGQSAREIAQEVKGIIENEYVRERMAWA